MKKIAIIGGGIIGMTAAAYLDPEKFQVTVFDEGLGQATKASAGIISPWLSKRRNKKWYQLAKDGAHFYEKLVTDFGLDSSIYQKSGTLIIRPEKSLKKLEEFAREKREQAPEIGQISLLSPEETKKEVPLLKEQASLKISGGGRLDGLNYLNRMQEIIKQNGAQIIKERASLLTNEENDDDEKIMVTSQTKREGFDYVILSPGPHLKDLLAPLGYQVDIRPQKGQLLVYQTGFKDNHEWPVVVLDGEADLIPFPHGKIILGATHENDGGWDLAPTEEAYLHLTTYAKQFLDQNLAQELFDAPHEFRVGTRAYTGDFAPFFSPLTDNPNIIAASGLGSSGLTTGPYMGYKIADYCNSGQWDEANNSYQKDITTYIKRDID
ncbi:FAD-dependent oxidoreductase [Streptococcaceae bacterium ESL0729]|nr:FAD-dependent oxidoreductase [Streptococcaceae bacterium ESL0729]